MRSTHLLLRYTLATVILLAFTTALRAQDAVRWDESEVMAHVAQKTEPVYPAMARQARVAGSVKLELNIDAEGKVEKCQVVSGNPLLAGSAMSAVRGWKFKPPTADGKPCKATAFVVFNFKL